MARPKKTETKEVETEVKNALIETENGGENLFPSAETKEIDETIEEVSIQTEPSSAETLLCECKDGVREACDILKLVYDRSNDVGTRLRIQKARNSLLRLLEV